MWCFDTIYVVDDEPQVLRAATVLLQSYGFAVSGFQSAEEFLEGFDVDDLGVLLLDVRLPGMSGVELAQMLSKERANLPIILMSGHENIENVTNELNDNCLAIVSKPFDVDELLDVINKVIPKFEKRVSGFSK